MQALTGAALGIGMLGEHVQIAGVAAGGLLDRRGGGHGVGRAGAWRSPRPR